MVSAEVVIKNPTGLHARPAVKLVNLSKGFQSAVTITCGERNCDAKSIFKVLHCNFKIGETVVVKTDGTDEEEALKQMLEYINGLEE
ncbi:MAG: HPr family phosphocarrier protein [Treponema sp.]|nr:HPr family phosphocarrier protein [Treponema sp.]